MQHYLSIFPTCIMRTFRACSNTQSSKVSNNRDKRLQNPI